jgi:chromate transport protein ChrA
MGIEGRNLKTLGGEPPLCYTNAMTALPFRDLARLFLHLGSTAYGGLAMVEPMRRRVVAEREWLSQMEFLDGLAVCQMLPGATVVQL